MGETREGTTAPIRGTVLELYRYPVKSMGGEPLQSAAVEEAGIRGDRVRVLLREKDGERLTAREAPRLLHYAAYWEELASDPELGSVRVRTPEGHEAPWDDEALFAGLEALAGETLAWMVYGAEDPLTGVDDAPLLLATDATVRELARSVGGEREVALRFRPNVILRMDPECDPYSEQGWIGRRFRLGDAELEIVKGCERCSMITIDPATLERDPSVLKLVTQQYGGVFGVYARVVRKGRVERGSAFIKA